MSKLIGSIALLCAAGLALALLGGASLTGFGTGLMLILGIIGIIFIK